MKLIVGLGNPGKEYAKTRHNIGFMAIDYFCNLHNLSFQKEKFDGLYLQTIINDEKVIILKPQKYINLSGEVISKYLDYFKIKVSDMLIVHDDLDLKLGKYKLKAKGSSGGHNGLKNIELHLHTNEYYRWKIGISNDKTIDTKDYVLSKISKEDLDTLTPIIKLTDQIIPDFINNNFEILMNKYHM